MLLFMAGIWCETRGQSQHEVADSIRFFVMLMSAVHVFPEARAKSKHHLANSTVFAGALERIQNAPETVKLLAFSCHGGALPIFEFVQSMQDDVAYSLMLLSSEQQKFRMLCTLCHAYKMRLHTV